MLVAEVEAAAEMQRLRDLLAETEEGLQSQKAAVEEGLKREMDKDETLMLLNAEAKQLDAKTKQQRDKLHAADRLLLASNREYEKLSEELGSALLAVQEMYSRVCRTETVELGGIGIKIEAPLEACSGESMIRVDDIIEGGPAGANGKMAVDDILVEVQGRDLSGLPVDEVRTLIVGPVGSPVTIRARSGQDGSEYVVTLLRWGSGSHAEGHVQEKSNRACERADRLHEQISQLEGELSDTQREAEELRAELEGLRQQLQDKEKLVEQISEELASTKSLVESERARSAQVGDAKDQLEQDLAAEREEIARLVRELGLARQELESACTRISAQKSSQDELRAELEQAVRDHAEVSGMLDSDRVRMGAALDDMERRIAAMLVAEVEAAAEMQRLRDLLAETEEGLQLQKAAVEEGL